MKTCSFSYWLGMRPFLRDSAAQELKSLTLLIIDINCLNEFLKGQGRKHKMYFREFDFKQPL